MAELPEDYYSVPELYDAISYAETGGERDPWVRTKARPHQVNGKWVGSSTAYGPVQLTYSTVNDYFNRYPLRFKSASKYIERFSQQGELFKRHGMNAGKPGYDARYDYGGSGNLNGAEDQRYYKWVAHQIMGIQLREAMARLGNNLNRDSLTTAFITRWRGKTEAEDPAYFRRVRQRLEYNRQLARQRKQQTNQVAARTPQLRQPTIRMASR